MENRNLTRSCSGFTLISTLVAIVLLLIALIGTSSMRYYSALDARKAAAQTSAARIALMLCESWRGKQGDESYDPIAHLGSDITITSDEGPTEPDGYTALGSYKIELDSDEDAGYQISYYATLSWNDVETGLRALTITVSWAQKDTGIDGLAGTDKSYSLTSYVLI